jgi:site-specific recombinase XerC
MTHVSPNDLRRTFASWMKQAGVDSKAVAELLAIRRPAGGKIVGKNLATVRPVSPEKPNGRK